MLILRFGGQNVRTKATAERTGGLHVYTFNEPLVGRTAGRRGRNQGLGG